MPEPTLTPEAQAQLAKLAVDIANNPKTRKGFAKLVKEIEPTRRFPDIEAEELEDKIKGEFDKRDREAEQRRVLADQERSKNALRDRYDDKAISEIEKLMEENGLSNYELGARLYAAETKTAKPTSSPDDFRFTMPNIDMKDFGNLGQIRQRSLYAAIDDIQRKRS